MRKGEVQKMSRQKRTQRTGELAPGPRRAVCAEGGPEWKAVTSVDMEAESGCRVGFSLAKNS